ncbi:aspartate/glutamate racemase family protein [Vagococcus elongatus]|uniref:Aspartate racemase n=1 Tax=Vagococcus elongatus TaxID=180344 RepID=A0A430AYB5_9ENTE|nr:aspartate/glutamate racemase family protein [Vagococcus elongatus]RSU13039.1 aspartate racemase [Vagococcus elongatus]
MKTIGLIGGMSWESTLTYYKLINEGVRKRLGGLHSAKCLLNSVDFEEIEHLQSTNQWGKAVGILGEAAQSLEKGGADFIILCTNTMHKIFDELTPLVSIPFIHISDATADTLNEKSIKNALLLGTKYTMTEDFIKHRLNSSGIDILIPNTSEIEEINRIIFEELCMGKIATESKKYLLEVIARFQQKNIQSVILGCTEIGLLINQSDCEIPVLDTTVVHSEKAVDFSLS